MKDTKKAIELRRVNATGRRYYTGKVAGRNIGHYIADTGKICKRYRTEGNTRAETKGNGKEWK